MGKMADLRGALASSLAGLDGVQESAYLLGSPTPPAAEVEPGPIEYDLAMGRGLDKWRFTVRVYVGASSDIGSQRRLDEFIAPIGSQSVKTLLEADPRLGGLCDDITVTKCSGYRMFQAAHTGSLWVGAEWTVEVLVSN